MEQDLKQRFLYMHNYDFYLNYVVELNPSPKARKHIQVLSKV